MYAVEKDRMECSCMGARNKEVLNSALILRRKHFELFKDGLTRELNAISGFEVDESYPYEFKMERIEHVNKQISDVNDDINHIICLIGHVSEIEICGD